MNIKKFIGITYDLREDYIKMGFSKEEAAEFDTVETIDGIEASLVKLGYEVERIGGIKSLVPMLAQGKRWDLVFNISEGMYGMGREALVPALLDAYRIPYTFSDPLVLALSIHKGMAKRVISDLGVTTPDFAIVEEMEDIYGINLPYPLFVKPVGEGTSKGIDGNSKVHNFNELESVCGGLLQKFKQPVLVEEFLDGREFTVGVVGTGRNSKVIGAMEIIIKVSGDQGYSYQNKVDYERVVEYRPAEGTILDECSRIALKVWRGLGCKDGGRVDLKMDSNGILNFIEVNPLAGLNPVYSDLPILSRMFGISYDRLLELIMEGHKNEIEV